MGTSGNRDCQWASRSVLKDFTEDTAVCSKMGQPEWCRRIGDGAYNIAESSNYRLHFTLKFNQTEGVITISIITFLLNVMNLVLFVVP